MKYVLDSSVAFKWVVTEADTPSALKLRDDYRNGIHELITPDFFPIEVLHAITRAERQGLVSVQQGGALWQAVMLTCPLLIPAVPLPTRAYSIASNARIGIYDCVYVALAERERCEFITADQRLIRTLSPHFPFIISLASLP